MQNHRSQASGREASRRMAFFVSRDARGPMTELKHTPLNATHRALSARMVDFGGWDMPVNYGSQIDEHRAVRTDAGMFDVSHMCVVDFTGERVRAFFEYALANNVDKLQTPGRALYSCLLNPKGGVIDDLIVYYFGENYFRVVVNAGTAEKDIAWIGQLNAEGSFGLTITPRRDYAIVAVQGPNARDKVWQPCRPRAPPPTRSSRSTPPHRRHAVRRSDGRAHRLHRRRRLRDHLPRRARRSAVERAAGAGVRPAGLGARDTLRLEAGMNLYGQDMDDNVYPLDAGLAWTVDLISPRDFVGKGSWKPMVRRRRSSA